MASSVLQLWTNAVYDSSSAPAYTCLGQTLSYGETDQLARRVATYFQKKLNLKLPMKQQLLAYFSDYSLLLTGTFPHRSRINKSKVFTASLDHSIWFHRPFKIDEWLLYQIKSPSASNSRVFSRGNIFNNDGSLVASVAQEGLIRIDES